MVELYDSKGPIISNWDGVYSVCFAFGHFTGWRSLAGLASLQHCSYSKAENTNEWWTAECLDQLSHQQCVEFKSTDHDTCELTDFIMEMWAHQICKWVEFVTGWGICMENTSSRGNYPTIQIYTDYSLKFVMKKCDNSAVSRNRVSPGIYPKG